MKIFINLFILLVTTTTAFAQKTISGTVNNVKGTAIQGVSIKIKNTNKGTTTNGSGAFTLQVTEGSALIASAVGYKTTEATANDGVIIVMATQVDEKDAVVVLGSRSTGRVKTETAVPVDVIKINQLSLPSSRMDLTSTLNYAAPSFNYNKQSGSDGADHIDIGTLRGLGPDQTLVLLNGKRRHATAFVALFGTRGRAQSGTDLNAFAQSSVDRIEILRDGASAQYGSDAMAGVMNIIMKKDINKWSINTGVGAYYDTKFNANNFNQGNVYYAGKNLDGQAYNFSANNGVALGKKGGFINFSFDYMTQGKTFRQTDTLNWKTDKWALPSINTGRRAFGDGSVNSYGAMYNMELPLSDKVTFYSFGGGNRKNSEAYAYTRNWSRKPERFPVAADGTLLLDANIMRKDGFGEIYYNPIIATKITDRSSANGLKGKTKNEWNWDLSHTVGNNDFHFFGDKTFNASAINLPKQNSFDNGGFNFTQNTTNLDLSKSYPALAEGINIGVGAEVRAEKYNIYAGELGSYTAYFTDDVFYPNVNQSITPASGSQGFPGFSPTDATTAKRSTLGVYADVEANVLKEWLVNVAARYENYSDFGGVTTFKLASRYKVSDKVNIRSSASSGFRAPSLQQMNFSNTLTSFSSGQLVQSLIARNGSSISDAAGIPKLKQETSVNGSLGFTYKPIKNLTLTVDGYQIKIKDRVVLSGLFGADDPTLPISFRDQIPADVSTVQFFANAVNTTNVGLDILANYSKSWANNGLRVLLASNFQKTTIDAINVPAPLNTTELNRNTFYTDREKAFLTASAPNAKSSLSLEYTRGKVSIGSRITYFGKITLLGFGDATAANPNYAGINPVVPSDLDGSPVPENFIYSGKAVVDLFTTIKFSKKIALFAGVDNVLNAHPNLAVNPLAKGYSFDTESGGAWDSVQMGFNGRKLFARIAFTF